jgi:MYXO-CTERM domain-containing protein
MKSRYTRFLSLIPVAALAVTTASAASHIVNGSFETGVVPGNGSHENVDNSSVTGWTTGGSNGIVWYMTSAVWGSGGPSGGGARLVNVNGNKTISQSFSVTVGTEYTVSYWEKLRGGGGYMFTTLSLDAGTVTGTDGSPVGVSSGPASSITQTTAVNNAWTQHSFKFTPDTNAIATLTFGNDYLAGGGGHGDNDGTFVDLVSVTSIPEPSAALLGGLGMLALLRRRKR